MYQRYGDVRILERHWDAMERWVAYLVRHNPDLLWTRAPQQRLRRLAAVDADTPREVLATAYCAYDAQLMARDRARARAAPDARRTTRRCTATSSPPSRAYVGDDGLVEGDTQTAYLLALHMDLLPEELRARAAERLVADIERHDGHLTTGFLGVGAAVPGADARPATPTSPTGSCSTRRFPSWGYSIRHGATTIWERWDGWTEEHGFQTAR